MCFAICRHIHCIQPLCMLLAFHLMPPSRYYKHEVSKTPEAKRKCRDVKLHVIPNSRVTCGAKTDWIKLASSVVISEELYNAHLIRNLEVSSLKGHAPASQKLPEALKWHIHDCGVSCIVNEPLWRIAYPSRASIDVRAFGRGCLHRRGCAI